LSVYGFSQNNLTQDQIRRHATELGIPYEALQRLVDSYRVQTGLSNPNANGAQLLSVQELDFMQSSDTLKVNSYYRIRAIFSSQAGKNVFLYHLPNENFSSVTVISDSLLNIRQQALVEALIGVRADSYRRPRELFLVEIVAVRQ
jgi:hypothetical protein